MNGGFLFGIFGTLLNVGLVVAKIIHPQLNTWPIGVNFGLAIVCFVGAIAYLNQES